MHIISIHNHQFISQICTYCILIKFIFICTLSVTTMLIEPSHIHLYRCALKSVYHIQVFTHITCYISITFHNSTQTHLPFSAHFHYTFIPLTQHHHYHSARFTCLQLAHSQELLHVTLS